MREPLLKRLGRVIVPVGAGALVIALSASVWALALRERSNKRLYLEYQVYKVVTALTDLVRLQRLSADDTKDVLAFGLYGIDGKPITLYGPAPEALEPLGQGTPTARFSMGINSVIMIRALGGDLPGRRMMMMGAERGVRNRSVPPPGGSPQGGSPQGGSPPGGSVEQAARIPAISYIELSTLGFRREERLLIATAVAATLALAGLYAVIVAMARRFAAAEERAVKDRELVELGQAARTIAHEIKNPLGVIRIQCGILRRGADEATVAGLAIIDDEAMRLADLADRIRRFLKSGDEQGEVVVAGIFLEEFASRYREVIDADIDLDDDARIRIDKARLTEALDNLVANAMEATGQTAGPGVERPRLVARTRNSRVAVSVLDRGPGIPPERVARAFEPFYTTKERGTGLGLALARKNVHSAGGSLEYADRPGGGAVFTVTLPLA
jgi:two-component system sensor histidine kinase HydH